VIRFTRLEGTKDHRWPDGRESNEMRYTIDPQTGAIDTMGSYAEYTSVIEVLDTMSGARSVATSMISYRDLAELNALFNGHRYNPDAIPAKFPAPQMPYVLAAMRTAYVCEVSYRVQLSRTYLPDYTDCDVACAYCDPDTGEDQQDGPYVEYIWSVTPPSPAMFGVCLDGNIPAQWGEFREMSSLFTANGICVQDNDGDDEVYIFDYWRPGEVYQDGEIAHRTIVATSLMICREDGGRMEWEVQIPD
jgi:hypothetical protein